MKLKASFLAFVAMLGFAGNVLAAGYMYSTPAVQGYDVVSYFTGKTSKTGTRDLSRRCGDGRPMTAVATLIFLQKLKL